MCKAVVHACRYGPPIYWQRDSARGSWLPTTNYPPGVEPPPQPAKPTYPEDAAAAAAKEGGLEDSPPASPAPKAKRARGGPVAALKAAAASAKKGTPAPTAAPVEEAEEGGSQVSGAQLGRGVGCLVFAQAGALTSGTMSRV